MAGRRWAPQRNFLRGCGLSLRCGRLVHAHRERAVSGVVITVGGRANVQQAHD